MSINLTAVNSSMINEILLSSSLAMVDEIRDNPLGSPLPQQQTAFSNPGFNTSFLAPAPQLSPFSENIFLGQPSLFEGTGFNQPPVPGLMGIPEGRDVAPAKGPSLSGAMVGASIGAVAGPIGAAVGAVGGAILAKPAANLVGGVLEGTGKAIGGIANVAGDVVKGVGNTVGGAVKGIGNAIKNIF